MHSLTERTSLVPVMVMLGLILPAGSAFGDEGSASREIPPRAIEIYQASGLELQMQTVEPQIIFGLEQHKKKLSPQVYAVLESVVRQQFADELLRERALSVVAEAWDTDYANDSLDWLNGDLGKRITRLEEYSSTSEGMVGIQQYAVGLRTRPPSESRVAAIRRLNKAYGGTDFLVDATLAISLAVAVGKNAVRPEEDQLEVPELRKVVEADRDYLRAQMDDLILIYHLFTYSGLVDEEIVAYAEFLESDAGSWYVNTLSDAYIQPLVELSLELGPELKQALVQPDATASL